MNRPIYLDNQATTPIDPRVLKVMRPLLEEEFGNPASIHHAYGWNAEKAVAEARRKIADIIGALPTEIVFTSGATESNNLALKGLAFSPAGKERKHIIVSKVEHKCILGAAHYLEKQGFEVTYLNVDEDGLISPEQLERHIRLDTLLVSVIYANNEIGVIQNIEALAKICRENEVYFHTDAAQAFGKININVDQLGIDLMSISGHKVYGPKGIGALYVRQTPHVPLQPQMHGGGQEFGLRSGTLPTHLIAGLGEAARIAQEEMQTESTRQQQLRDALIQKVLQDIPGAILNGSIKHRLSGNVSFSFANADADLLFMELQKKVAASNGSACSGITIEPSHVLLALGRSPDEARSSVRFGIGRFTTEEDIKAAGEHLCKAVQQSSRDLI
jgi:cysteine desulfurase